jgi:hypothetical protein
MTRRTVDHRTARRDALIATIWVPLAIIVASEVVIIIAGLNSSSPLIVHWGGNGADRTGPWWTYAILIAAIGVPIVAGTGFFLARATQLSGFNAWMPAVVVGVTVFHTIGLGVAVVLFNHSPLVPLVPLLGGAVLGVIAALVTWRVLPHEEPLPPSVPRADSIPVKSTEVAAWTGRFIPPGALVGIIVGAIVAIVVLDLVLNITTRVHTLAIWIAPAILMIVLVSTAEFRIRASSAGLTVRSAIGWPAFRIPANDIARAGVVTIDPLADFGGWGLRWVVGPGGKGRWALASHKGEALEVVRKDGRSMVISVEDAATAAAVLETYAGKSK